METLNYPSYVLLKTVSTVSTVSRLAGKTMSLVGFSLSLSMNLKSYVTISARYKQNVTGHDIMRSMVGCFRVSGDTQYCTYIVNNWLLLILYCDN